MVTLTVGVAKGGTGRTQDLPNHSIMIVKDQNTLIEQSNIILKQSVGQVVPRIWLLY